VPLPSIGAQAREHAEQRGDALVHAVDYAELEGAEAEDEREVRGTTAATIS
jgi:hypothetical protein